MSTTPPDAPTDPSPGATPWPGTGDTSGPRVTGDEIRDLSRLRRSRDNRRIAGVAGGLARHFDVDPIITRVTLVVLTFFGGAGLIVYGVCWLIVPSDDATEATVRLDPRSRSVALMIVGVLATLALLGDSLGGWSFPWPLAIIGAVVLAVALARGRERDAAYPRFTPPPPTGPGAPTWSTPAPPPAWQPPRRRGPLLFGYTLALIAIGIGVLAMIDLAGADITDSAYPALALGITGTMLVLGAFWGRAGGLILLGLVCAVGTVGATAIGECDIGHLDESPTTAALVRSDYRLDAGEIDVDLTDVVDPQALDGRTITLQVDLGRIAVVLPRDVDVTIISEVAAGNRSILGDDSNGDSGTDRVSADTGTPTDNPTDTGTPSLTLDVTVGLGEIQITREGANR
ncbi:hypothetical protein BH11ACT8_BH11ACT8_19060 [soil metagenome]